MKIPKYDIPTVENFKELLTHIGDKFADLTAYRLKDNNSEIYDVTYSTFVADVDALGTSLCGAGLSGKNIAVIGENRYEWAVSYLAVSAGTGTVVPIDKELSESDISDILSAAHCSGIIVSKKYLKKVSSVLSDGVLLICMDDVDDVKSYSELIKQGKELIAGGDTSFTGSTVKKDDLASILYTSGTTGSSKGVMLSHYNICSNIMSVRSSVMIGPGDRTLSILPLHHTYECSLGFLAMLYSGATICFTAGLRQLAGDMKEYKPTIIITVPLLLENVYGKIMAKVNKQKNGSLKLSFGKSASSIAKVVGLDIRRSIFKDIHAVFGGELRLLIVGAAAMDSEIIKAYHSFGINLYTGYGLTECSPLVIGNNDGVMTTDSVGVPIEHVKVRLDNVHDGIGEILVKGPNVMQGYYENPEETEKAFTADGWLKTGDLATMGKNCTYTIVGRSKNVIIAKNGKNVYPEELEYHLNQSDYVKESLVSANDDIKEGDSVVSASILPDFEKIKESFDHTFSEGSEEVKKLISDIVSTVNDKLPHYKSIKDIDIRNNDFVKTTTLKIKRYIEENGPQKKYLDIKKDDE